MLAPRVLRLAFQEGPLATPGSVADMPISSLFDLVFPPIAQTLEVFRSELEKSDLELQS
jgi:hypothetical protein